MPAVWYPVASQVSAGTSETGGTYKEVTIADAQAGDLLVAVGLGENSGPNANSAISTTSGSTGTWTVAKAPTVTNGDTVAAGGYTTVSTTGAVVVKIKVATNSNADYSGGGVLRIPAAEVGASYGWLNAGFNADADGQISGVLSTGSLLLYAAADWNANAAAASTAGTPSTNVTYHQRVYSNGHYSLWIASWTAQAAGTRNYGPSGLSGGDWSGLLFRMDSGPVVIPVDPATLSLTGQAVAGPAPVTLGVWGHHDDGPYFGEDYTDAAAAGTGTPCGAVILSAGEAGHTWASGYSVGRENGLKAAWATLLGVANSWTDTTITLAGKTVATSTLAGTQCRLIFLRIPDGGFVNPLYSIGSVNGYLMKLWTGALSSVTTHDSANSYTKQQLLDVLAAAITLYGASVVRHQNHLEPFGSDHTDHTTAGKFAAAACYSLSPSPTQYAYLGYVTSTMAANVFGADLAAKEAAFGAYWPYDSEMNSGNWRAAWIDRCYKYPDPASGTPTATTRRILTSTDDTALGTNTDAGNTVVGMGFTVTAGPDLLLTEITLRIPAAQNALVESLPVTAHLWTGTGNYPTTYLGGARIAALTRGATNVATLERPVRLIAGQRYWVTAHFPQGYYPRTANVFTSGAKTSGDGRLLAYQASTAPNSTYDQTQIRNSAYLGSGVVPTNATFGDPWYGLDVTVADIAAGTQTIDADPATSALAGVQPAAAGTGTAPLAADTAAAVLAGIQALLTGTGPAGATADVAAAVLAGAQPDLAGSGQSAAVVDPALLQLGGVQATPSGSGPAAATVDPALLAVAGTGQAAGGAGATPVSVDPAPLTVSGQDVAGGGTILLAVDVATLTLTGTPPDAAGAAATLAVDVAALAIAAPTPSLAALSAPLPITPAGLVLAGQDVAVEGGPVAASVDPAVLQLAGPGATATGEAAATLTADTALVELAGQTPATEATIVVLVDTAVLALAGPAPVAAGQGGAEALLDPATLALDSHGQAAAGVGTATVAAPAAAVMLLGVAILVASNWRDITVTIGAPGRHPFTPGNPAGNPLQVAEPAGHPFTVHTPTR